MLGQENQRCAISASTSGVQMLTATTASPTPTRQTRPARRLHACRLALGLHDEPAGSEQAVAEHERDAGQDRERREEIERAAGEVAAVDLEALDEGAEHDALRERRHRRAEAEGHAPERLQARAA